MHWCIRVSQQQGALLTQLQAAPSLILAPRFWRYLKSRLLSLLDAGVDVLMVFDGGRLPAKRRVEEARAR